MRVRVEALMGESESTFRLSNAGEAWLRESFLVPDPPKYPALVKSRLRSGSARHVDRHCLPVREGLDDTILPQLHCF